MLTIEEMEEAAVKHIEETCSPLDMPAVKEYAKSDFLAGAQFALDKCLEEYNELLETISGIISVEELEERAGKIGKKFKRN